MRNASGSLWAAAFQRHLRAVDEQLRRTGLPTAAAVVGEIGDDGDDFGKLTQGPATSVARRERRKLLWKTGFPAGKARIGPIR